MSRISVVVPVYNVEDYLDWCLESLRSQSLADIEIICVNDGSTDRSLEKLVQWAERDSRIKIVDKPNGGLSSARNAGIRAATSDYVCFLDSDDRFRPKACETMVQLFRQTGADVLTFGASCYPKGAGNLWLKDVLSPRDVVYESFSPDILFAEKSRPFVWRTACRRSLLIEKNILFDETLRFGEDQVFDFALYPRAGRVVLSSKKLYDYRVSREGSLMAGMRDDSGAKLLEHVNIVRQILTNWDEGGFLLQYPVDMISFALDFSLYDALKLDDKTYTVVAAALGAVLSSYWSVEDVSEMPLETATMRMALNACYRHDIGSLARKKLVFDYYLQQYGRRAVLKKLVKRA